MLNCRLLLLLLLLSTHCSVPCRQCFTRDQIIIITTTISSSSSTTAIIIITIDIRTVLIRIPHRKTAPDCRMLLLLLWMVVPCPCPCRLQHHRQLL